MDKLINKEKSERKEVEVIVFESNSKKIEGKQMKQNLETEPKPLIDLEKARHDVYRFGITGFDKEKAESAKEDLAIKLGAKPPKRKNINYKELIEETKKRKLEELEARKRNQKMGTISKRNSKKLRKKNKKSIKNLNCQIGKYKDGIQFISKHDIEKIKRKK